MPSPDALLVLEALPGAAWLADPHGVVLAANAPARATGVVPGAPWWSPDTEQPATLARRRADGSRVRIRLAPCGDAVLGIEGAPDDAERAGLATAVSAVLDGVTHDVGNALNAIGLQLPLLAELWRDLEPLAEVQAAADPAWRPARLSWERARGAASRAFDALSDRTHAIADLARAIDALLPRQPLTIDAALAAAALLCAYRVRRAGATIAITGTAQPAPPTLTATTVILIDAALRWAAAPGTALDVAWCRTLVVTALPGAPRPAPAPEWHHRLQAVCPSCVASHDNGRLTLRAD